MLNLYRCSQPLHLVLFLVWSFAAFVANDCLFAQRQIEKFVIADDIAPGLGGNVAFQLFDIPRLGQNGEFVFHARVQGDGVSNSSDWALWKYDGAELTMLMREGDAAPGLGGATFQKNGSGTYAFLVSPLESFSSRQLFQKDIDSSFFPVEADYYDDGSAHEGVWIYDNGSLSLFTAQDEQAPGFADGVTVSSRTVDSIFFDPNGGFYIKAGVSGVGFVWWFGKSGTTEIVQANGDPVPGDETSSFTEFDIMAVGENGYFGSFDYQRSDGSAQDGIMVSHLGQWESVVERGEPAIGLAADEFFGGVLGSGLSFSNYSPSMNALGEVAFEGTIIRADGSQVSSGNWVGSKGNMRMVARAGREAPGAGGATFTGISPPVINNNSTYAFVSGLQGNGVPNGTGGIWMGNGSNVQLVAMDGQQAPGFADGITFKFIRENSLAMNSDMLLFFAEVEGEGIDGNNDGGLWLYKNGVLRNLIQMTDEVEFGDGEEPVSLRWFSHLPGRNNGHMGWIDEENDRVVFDARVGAVKTGIFSISTDSEIAGRHVFYNDSSFDGNNSGIDPEDILAIAEDKKPLLIGQTATFENYSSTYRGLNGIMIEINGAQPTISLADFEFRMGTNNDFANWASAPAPSGFSVVHGTQFPDRIVMTWDEGVLKNTWLEVKLLANTVTGLSSDQVFYYGNIVGETGDSTTDAIVNLVDVDRTRQNQTGFGVAGIDNPFDIDRDGRVNLIDVALVRSNQSGFNIVELITPSDGSGKGRSADPKPGMPKQGSGPSRGFSGNR